MADDATGADKTKKPGECGDFSLPEANFTTFILSLASSALVHLGDTPDPETGEIRANPPLAKHTIDILAMLQAKTCGNLTGDEEKILNHMLYELRLVYVGKNK